MYHQCKLEDGEGNISDIGCHHWETSASEIMMKLNVRSSSQVTDGALHERGLRGLDEVVE